MPDGSRIEFVPRDATVNSVEVEWQGKPVVFCFITEDGSFHWSPRVNKQVPAVVFRRAIRRGKHEILKQQEDLEAARSTATNYVSDEILAKKIAVAIAASKGTARTLVRSMLSSVFSIEPWRRFRVLHLLENAEA